MEKEDNADFSPSTMSSKDFFHRVIKGCHCVEKDQYNLSKFYQEDEIS